MFNILQRIFMFNILQRAFRLLSSENYKTSDAKTKRSVRAWLMLTGLSYLGYIAGSVWLVLILVTYNYGMMKYNRSDFAGAIPLLQRSLKLEPWLIRSRSYLGYAFLSEKRWSDANREYQILDAAHVATGYDYYEWGYVLYQTGHIASARMRLQQAMSAAERSKDTETVADVQRLQNTIGSE